MFIKPHYFLSSRYCSEFAKTVLIARKMAYQCARKITHLVLESDAFMAQPSSSSNNHHNHHSNSGGSNSQPERTNNSPAKNPTIPGTNQPLPPILAALLELQNCQYNRMIIMTLSSVLQTITLQEFM